MNEARVQHYRQYAGEGAASGECSYNGLRIYSLTGLHEFVARTLQEELPRGSIVDLGAGTGALSARCRDLGFRVTAVDAVVENFRAPGVSVSEMDLDAEHWEVGGAPFDAVLAIEIIEHLENPCGFLRACYALLNPGGLAIITTPNIQNAVSKAMFCRSGRYQWFSETQSREGHITPLSAWQIHQYAEEAGFRVRRTNSFGDPFGAVRHWWRMRLFAKLIQLIDTLPKEQAGEILVTLLERR